jgi:hypothetical protein
VVDARSLTAKEAQLAEMKAELEQLTRQTLPPRLVRLTASTLPLCFREQLG